MPAGKESRSPTKNELKLLKHLGTCESNKVKIYLGEPPCHEIHIENEDGLEVGSGTVPFSASGGDIEPTIGGILFSYPSLAGNKRTRGIEARNLKAILLDVEAHFERRGLLADEVALRMRLEYGELDCFNDRTT